MKTCVKKVLLWAICTAFVLLGIILFTASSTDFLLNVWEWIIKLGEGKWWLGIFMLPLAILGGINSFRGALKNAEADDAKLKLDKVWKITIYSLITLAGYGCMLIVFFKVFS